jgi:hypothetical protein
VRKEEALVESTAFRGFFVRVWQISHADGCEPVSFRAAYREADTRMAKGARASAGALFLVPGRLLKTLL